MGRVALMSLLVKRIIAMNEMMMMMMMIQKYRHLDSGFKPEFNVFSFSGDLYFFIHGIKYVLYVVKLENHSLSA